MKEKDTEEELEKILYKDLSYKIVQSCSKGTTSLGRGILRRSTKKPSQLNWLIYGVGIDRQKLVEVFFKGVQVGEYRLDMVAERKIVLELKAVSELNGVFEAQVLSYLKASGLKLGLLINFGGKKVEVRRIVN